MRQLLFLLPKKYWFIVAISMVLSTNLVLALDLPRGSLFDGRIKDVFYNEHDVVEVKACSGVATQIVFGEDEKVLDIASGYTLGWEFQHRKNNLYLKPRSIKVGQTIFKPMSDKWNTNLIVTTNRHIYSFQLILHSKKGNKRFGYDPQIAYRIAFKYPVDEKIKASLAADKNEIEKRFNEKPVPRNWNYAMHIGTGSKNIAPAMAFDDGRFTYFQFPNNREIPAIFVVSEDKTETIVNTHVDPKSPDVIAVHRVAPEFVLRLGNAVVGVFNEAYDPDGVPPSNGTTAKGVQRVQKLLNEKIELDEFQDSATNSEEEHDSEIRASIERRIRQRMKENMKAAGVE